MNNVTEESKSAAIKTLAIVGLVAAVIIGLFIVVKIVSYLPTGFQQLAAIVDSLRDGGTELSLAPEKSIVNSGEPFKLNWSKDRGEGIYIFSYRCIEGISAEVRTLEGDIIELDCEEEFELGERTLREEDESFDLIFISERERFTDVSFSIAFIPDGASEPSIERSSVVTVVNASIPQGGEGGENEEPTTPPPAEPEPQGETPVAPPRPEPTPSVPPVQYRTVPVVTKYFPVSDPRGYVDLEIVFLGIGTIGRDGAFIPRTTLYDGDDGAVRFYVKNIGTKTSGAWTFDAELPGIRNDYRSNYQPALLPQERAIITLSIGDIEGRGTEYVRASVHGGGDYSRSSNNQFSVTVRVE